MSDSKTWSAGMLVLTGSHLLPVVSTIRHGQNGGVLVANTAQCSAQSPELLMINTYPLIEILDASQKKVVSIMSDGRVVVGEGANLDETAKRFWQSIRKMNPFENETRIYKAYIRELERENNELKARIAGETVVGSHLDDDGEGAG